MLYVFTYDIIGGLLIPPKPHLQSYKLYCIQFDLGVANVANGRNHGEVTDE
jgi:hypothetical protein